MRMIATIIDMFIIINLMLYIAMAISYMLYSIK